MSTNQEAVQFLGAKDLTALTDLSLFDFVPPALRASIRDRLEALLSSAPGPWKIALPILSDLCRELTTEAVISAISLEGRKCLQIALDCADENRDRSGGYPVSELLDATQEPVFTWRLSDSRIQYWNAAAEQLYGYSAAQACGQASHDLLATESVPAMAEIRAKLRVDRRWSGELIHRTQSGQQVIVETRMTVLENNGQSTVLETNRDITVRRQAEQALRFHFQLNKNITEQAVDPIFVIGGNGDIIFANSEAERVFGWTQEELIGQPLHATLHHEYPDGLHYPAEECPLLKAQTTGQIVRAVELVFFHKDGTPIHVSCSNSPLFFENQEVGAVLIIRDISEQKRMERALAASEERLRVAVAASGIGTWDLNLISGAASVDENCRHAMGLESDSQHFLTSWLRAIHPEDRHLSKERIEAALNPSGTGQFHLECRTLGRTDQKLRYVQAQGQAFFDGAGESRKAVRLIGTVQDITDRKRGEEALRRANLDLQQFAYAAAHDLQEPLRNIVNLLGLYQRNIGDKLDRENNELIESSIADARRMHQMVKDLLLFTDVHQGNEAVTSCIDANVVFLDVAKNLSSIISETGAEISSETLPQVKMRPAHLMQLLQNLLSNALKYRKPGEIPKVRISARKRGAEWLFSVSDNGIGFDQAYAQRIFGVFKRLHGRYEYPGSGIGLAICSRIVHIYGGRIWAEGTPGKGAIFYFTLPVANPS